MRKPPTPWWESAAGSTSRFPDATAWWRGQAVIRIESDGAPRLLGGDERCGCRRVHRDRRLPEGQRRWVLVPCERHGIELGADIRLSGVEIDATWHEVHTSTFLVRGTP